MLDVAPRLRMSLPICAANTAQRGKLFSYSDIVPSKQMEVQQCCHAGGGAVPGAVTANLQSFNTTANGRITTEHRGRAERAVLTA
jgi:hypothetical protein